MKHKLLNGGLGFLMVLALWQLGSSALQKSFFPGPGESFAAFATLMFRGKLGSHFVISAYRIAVSILLATVIGVPLGMAMGRIPMLGKLLNPMVYLIYPLPKVVFLPIIVVLMGLGNGPKIFLITLVIIFQIAVVTRDAAATIPIASIQSMQSLNATPLQMIRHLIMPACLPQIFTSLRITLGTAIAVLFFAETFASFDGLGYFILNGMETRNYPAMYAGIIAMAILGLLLYWVVDMMEYYFCRYQKITR